MKTLINSKITLPPGEYWVGDPCYQYPQKKWGEFCNYLFPDKRGPSLEGEVVDFNGDKFFICSTAYGDGCYPLVKGNKVIDGLGVDSGCLSIVPMWLALSWGREISEGNIIELEEECEIEFADGNFSFGDYSVVTDGSEE